jgi:hypothetical protein
MPMPRTLHRSSLRPGWLFPGWFLAGWLLLGAWGSPSAAAGPIFEDATARTGLDFVHWNGMYGELFYLEIMGPGGALFDYDGDGDLDVYVTQGASLGDRPPAETTRPPREPILDRLYRNDLGRDDDGRPLPHFVDVTEASGIRAPGYGMGVTTGDYDGDGWIDLYVVNHGPNQLFRNRGDGTFEDVTAESGADDPRWSAGAVFLDVDDDGRLDLFVVNYVDYDPANNVRCFANSSRRDYCGPSAFPPVSDRLLRNLGPGADGRARFEDVSLTSGIGRLAGPGLGVVAADFNGDRRTDLYVTNDGRANHLWLHQGTGDDGRVRFLEDALLAGVAVNREGRPEASMGVDAADFDGDGDLDLFMTHLLGETNTLYVNDGGGLFTDRTLETGLGPASLGATSFGTAWLDFDLDGWLDLAVINGAVKVLDPLLAAGDPYPLGQPDQLFHNLGGRGFEEVSDRAGDAFTRVAVGRAAAAGDVDGDGDDDLLVLDNSGPAHLFLTVAGDGEPWLGVRPVAGPGGAPPVGSRVAVERGDGRWIHRRVTVDGGYATANDPRVTVGVGEGAPTVVRWIDPDGDVHELRRPPVGRYLTVSTRWRAQP